MGRHEIAKVNVVKNCKVIPLDPMRFLELDNTVTKRSNYHSIKKICVITEDRGNGFQFIKNYLYFNYPEMAGVIIGATGNSSIKYVMDAYDYFNTYILVIDRGVITKDIYNRIIKEIGDFKDAHRNAKIYILQPICIEEIMLSFYKINNYIDINDNADAKKIMGELRDVLKGRRVDVDYSRFKNADMTTAEKICEHLLEVVTDGTVFEYSHGRKKIKGERERVNAYMSICWRCPCCTANKYIKDDENNILKLIEAGKCKKPDICNKSDYIAKYSLLCGLTYIVDKIYGFRFHDKGYWHNMDKSYFNKLVREI